MGTMEDLRKFLQDLITPDLKELKANLEALAQRMDDRFAAAENLAAERHNQVLVEIRRNQDIASLWQAVRNIQERLEHIQ